MKVSFPIRLALMASIMLSVSAFTSISPNQTFRSRVVSDVMVLQSFESSTRTLLLNLATNSGETFPKGTTSNKSKENKHKSQNKSKKRRKKKSSSTSSHNRTPNRNPIKQAELWNNRYQELLEFYNSNGHSNVPYNYPNSKLSRWVTNQRQNKKLQRRSMTNERIEKLDALQFAWETTRCTWEDRFQELQEYSLLYGHCNVLPSTNLDLSRFVSSQRRQYKLFLENCNDPTITSLNEKRIEALTSIGFEFENHFESAWMAKYNQLKQFQQRHHHCFVPCKDKNLRSWVDSQRTAYRLNNDDSKQVKMSQERIELLNDIQFVWDPVEAKFQERIEEIRTFRDTHGHSNIPMSDNPSLHTWIKKQQIQYQKSITGEKSYLTLERIELLRGVGVTLDVDLSNIKQRRSKTQWNVKYDELRAYVKEHGHCRVPQKHPRLGEFVKSQRYSFKQMQLGKKSSMTQERVDKLDSIGFEWCGLTRTRPLRRIGISKMLPKSTSTRTTNELVTQNSENLLRFYEKRSLWGIPQ